MAIGVGASALLVATALPASADDHVVVDNLVSPLGFAVDDDGTLVVAEAFAGLLTEVAPDGTRTELASAPPGSGTAGVALTKNGSIYYTLTLPPEQGGAPDTALARVNPDGSTQVLASLAEFEAANNPDADNTYGLLAAKKSTCFMRVSKFEELIGPARYKGQVESNPYAVADEGYGSALVADAAGNSIVRVAGGQVSTVAVLPAINQKLDKPTMRKLMRQINRKLEKADKDPVPRDYFDSCIGKLYASNPVPTDVEIGPDGYLYVSTLPGFPELPGYARVFKVDAGDGSYSTAARGLTGATDLAVAADGTIYVSELFAFQVSAIAPDGGPVSSTFVDCPVAVEIDSAGDVLVARGGLCDDSPGQIVRLD
jgi:DNA-binding beta-propeller fold protein YncE